VIFQNATRVSDPSKKRPKRGCQASLTSDAFESTEFRPPIIRPTFPTFSLPLRPSQSPSSTSPRPSPFRHSSTLRPVDDSSIVHSFPLEIRKEAPHIASHRIASYRISHHITRRSLRGSQKRDRLQTAYQPPHTISCSIWDRSQRSRKAKQSDNSPVPASLSYYNPQSFFPHPNWYKDFHPQVLESFFGTILSVSCGLFSGIQSHG
jgi:hypothetical protein